MSVIKELRKYCKEHKISYTINNQPPFRVYPTTKKELNDIIEILKKNNPLYSISWWGNIYFKGSIVNIWIPYHNYKLEDILENFLKTLDIYNKKYYNKLIK